MIAASGFFISILLKISIFLVLHNWPYVGWFWKRKNFFCCDIPAKPTFYRFHNYSTTPRRPCFLIFSDSATKLKHIFLMHSLFKVKWRGGGGRSSSTKFFYSWKGVLQWCLHFLTKVKVDSVELIFLFSYCFLQFLTFGYLRGALSDVEFWNFG